MKPSMRSRDSEITFGASSRSTPAALNSSFSGTSPNSLGSAPPRKAVGSKSPVAVRARSPTTPLARDSPAISRLGEMNPPALSLGVVAGSPNFSWGGAPTTLAHTSPWLSVPPKSWSR